MDRPEKIEQLEGVSPRYDGGTPNPNPFIDSPGDHLAKWVVIHLRKDKLWRKIFRDFIDAWPRDDYQMVNLPALRIYSPKYSKDAESWFITGQLYLDIILPASIRRIEKEEIPDVLSNALMQQFRRPSFFGALCEVIPGLNELGKTFSVDKDLCYAWEDQMVPLTQIKANFRIDLREWDNYLEKTDRTKDDPFIRTLGDLEILAGQIVAVMEGSEEPQETLTTEQSLKAQE